MKCVICKHGKTKPGTTTVMLERCPLIMIVKCVPAQICQNCGEVYTDESVTARLLGSAEEAARAGAQLEVREYVEA